MADPNQLDKLTAASRARARLEDFEADAQRHALYPRGRGRGGIARWVGWLFIACVLVGLCAGY